MIIRAVEKDRPGLKHTWAKGTCVRWFQEEVATAVADDECNKGAKTSLLCEANVV